MSADKESKSAPADDKELDDLLNSALEDFDKPKASETTTTDKVAANDGNAENELLNADFAAQAKFFEERIATLFSNMGGDGGEPAGDFPSADQLNLNFQRMAEATSMALDGQGVDQVDPNFVDQITQAIQGLKEGSDNISNPSGDMASMFSALQLNEGGPGNTAGGDNPFLPMVMGMMQSLLSVEVLLPSLKELLEKYPAWLAENGDKIDPADKERYIKQQDFFKIICAELESEKPDDSAEVKSERFKKVLDYMQKLHLYGQPPEELVGVGSDMPQIPTSMDGDQCSVM